MLEADNLLENLPIGQGYEGDDKPKKQSRDKDKDMSLD